MTLARYITLSFVLIVFLSEKVCAQDTNYIRPFFKADTVAVYRDTSQLFEDVESYIEPPAHSPQRAAMLSAVLPGLGQAYNKDYWKIPIIYAAGAVIVYFLLDYSEKYDLYYKAYSDYWDGHDEHDLTDSYRDLYFWEMPHIDKVSSLKQLKDHSRRWRDLDYILLGGLYIVNIIEANVSAHFKTFDISDDLTYHIQPIIYKNPDFLGAVGIKICIQF